MEDFRPFGFLSPHRTLAHQFVNHLVLLGAVASVHATEPWEMPVGSITVPTTSQPSTVPALPSEEAKASVQWAIYLLQQNLPATYRKEKNWGDTKKVYAGIDIDNDGLKIKTHRKYKNVRHGKWLKYNIDLKDPTDPRYLSIEVTRAEVMPGGRIWLNFLINAHVAISARQERWNYGVQMYSLSTRAGAKLRMNIATDIGFQFDYAKIPPDVIFDPVVQSADMQLIDLEVDQISKLGSDVAEGFGDLVERILRDDYLPKQSERLPEKLNQQIDKRRDRLRISASDWLSSYLQAK